MIDQEEKNGEREREKETDKRTEKVYNIRVQ